MGLANIVFWTHKKNKCGEHPIYIRVIEDRKAKYLSTGLRAKPEDWNESENRFKVKYRKLEDNEKANQHIQNNEILEKRLREAEKLIKDLILEDKLISSEQVKQELIRNKTIGKESVLKFIDHIADELKKQQKVGTATCYKDLKRALIKFIAKSGKSDLAFKEVTILFLKKFEADFKERQVKETGISFYMRTLRAVFNRAIEQRICKKEMYPFDRYKVSDLNTKTTKRAIPKHEIELLKDYRISEESRKFHSLNFFLFSYYCWGINFADIASLKWENINNNRLTYRRLKTGKPYSLAILEPAQKILDYYRTQLFRGENNYIFPILDASKHISPESINNRTHKILTNTNQDLKEIGIELKISTPLTTYVARHTFATVLKKGGASVSKISEAMGHDSERTTQIYLDSFENDVLDDVCRDLL